MSMTTTWEDHFLNYFRGTALPSLTTLYAKLATADPGEAASFADLVGSFMAITMAAPVDGVDTERKIANSSDVTFTGLTTGAIITHVAWFNANTGSAGTMIRSDAILNSSGEEVAVQVGATGELTFATGNLSFSLD